MAEIEQSQSSPSNLSNCIKGPPRGQLLIIDDFCLNKKIHITMLWSFYLLAAALTSAVVGLPASNSLKAENVQANETHLYSPITYVLPADYTPQKK
jgi:hypothetical protein